MEDTVDTVITRLEAEMILSEWAEMYNSRDGMIRWACSRGMTKQRIALITGISRTTIDRILRKGDA